MKVEIFRKFWILKKINFLWILLTVTPRSWAPSLAVRPVPDGVFYSWTRTPTRGSKSWRSGLGSPINRGSVVYTVYRTDASRSTLYRPYTERRITNYTLLFVVRFVLRRRNKGQVSVCTSSQELIPNFYISELFIPRVQLHIYNIPDAYPACVF